MTFVLNATVVLLFIDVLIATLRMLATYAINEHSKYELKYFIKSIWILVGVSGAIYAWQVFVALDQSAKFMRLMNSARMVG